jgi:hypothetical protein
MKVGECIKQILGSAACIPAYVMIALEFDQSVLPTTIAQSLTFSLNSVLFSWM